MALTLQETFRVDAPVDRVWSYLIDPERVVHCLPGAELLEAEDDRTFIGRIRVKVGPVTGSFKGRAHFEELDEANRRVRMTGSGQEQSGGGSAQMTMTSQVVALDDGACEVHVDVQMDVVGKLVQFGRGMIEQISAQMFQQFANCVRATLEAVEEEPETVAFDGAVRADETGPTARSAAGASASQPRHPAAEPVNLIPVVLRALRSALARVFGRSAAR